jgi:hypothetical protein
VPTRSPSSSPNEASAPDIGWRARAAPRSSSAPTPHRIGFDDLAVAEPFGGMIQEFVYGQAVGLHDAF